MADGSSESSARDRDGGLWDSLADEMGADVDSGENGDLVDGGADAPADVSKDVPADVSTDVSGDAPGDVAPDTEPPFDSMYTFDDDERGKCPSSAWCQGEVMVENVIVGGEMQRAVHVWDTSSESMSRVIFDYEARSARRFVFDLFFGARTEWTLIAVHGTGALEKWGMWRLGLGARASSDNVSVSVWDGSNWSQIGELPGAALENAWSRVTVDASMTMISISVGSEVLQSPVKASEASGIKGIEFASSGTHPVGTHTYIDNLGMRNMD